MLDADVAWLASHAYDVKTFDCRTWRDSDATHDSLAATLGFPDYYGRNSAALNDCLSDLAIAEDGGTVLVFSRFDDFAKRDPRFANGMLDIIAHNARTFLLFGRRLLALVQSDDPRIVLEPVAAMAVSWNGQEWLDANRK